MNRRRTLKSFVAAAAAACGAHRLFGATAAGQSKHIRLYVEMDVPPAKEQEMLRIFHESFVPEAVKHEPSLPGPAFAARHAANPEAMR